MKYSATNRIIPLLDPRYPDAKYHATHCLIQRANVVYFHCINLTATVRLPFTSFSSLHAFLIFSMRCFHNLCKFAVSCVLFARRQFHRGTHSFPETSLKTALWTQDDMKKLMPCRPSCVRFYPCHTVVYCHAPFCWLPGGASYSRWWKNEAYQSIWKNRACNKGVPTSRRTRNNPQRLRTDAKRPICFLGLVPDTNLLLANLVKKQARKERTCSMNYCNTCAYIVHSFSQSDVVFATTASRWMEPQQTRNNERIACRDAT